MKKSFCISLIALVLVVAMVSSLTACFPDPLTTTTTNSSTTTTTGKPNGPDDPPSHTCVFGEWEVIEEATNTEDGLRERRCSCGKVEQEVIEASGKEYYIQYRNLKTADYPAENGYNSKDGLLNLPVPEAEGYVFVGWYTASIGGDLVDYIPEGSKKNYILFAHWELIPYEITYKNVPNNTNVTSYDIEDKLKLETPKWSGLVFTHWSDESGNIYKPDENITVLPERMHGDLILTANWKVLRNIATPTTNDVELISAYSSTDGMICFIFELGTIEHVVLDNIHPDMYYKYEGMPLNLTLSKTVSVGEETAESIAKTISKSVSSTHSFSSASNWANEYSLSQKTEVSIGTDIKFGKVVSASIEGNFGWEGTDTNSYGHTSSRDFSSSSSSETSHTVSSSLTYKKEMTSEITENISIDADLPSGYYAYVHAGNIRVFGVVTYEIATGNYYIDTYSRLDNMHSMIMYYADVNQLNNPSVEGLDFNIPEDKILSYVEEWKSTAWVEQSSGEFYFATFPSSFDKNHEIYKSMQQAPYEEYETETTKRVVTIEKVGYVYWHWMYDTVYNPKDGGCEQRTISDVKRQHGSSNYNYYFVEFYAIKSTLDCPAYSDRSYVDGYAPGKAPITYNARQALLDQGILTAQDGLGTPRMLRFEYFVCKYTDYVKGTAD